ncbi:MAG: response regulator [Bacteroidota bacterium]|nr:response regulator [Bacteroidota bacterium]
MKKRVLIYDDDVEILAVCRIILENQNFLVDTYYNCENIISDIDHAKPDIILMDLWIPEIGGEMAIVLMHDNPLTKHIPVILFSANEEIEKISTRVKANGYLKKPFDISTFTKTINQQIL